MKINIGLVDDHLIFLKSLGLMLETFGRYEISVMAANGQELQCKMKSLTVAPEIMLIDVNMPVMDGLSTVIWMNEHYPLTKLVALSVNDSDRAITSMIKAGCCAYMLKDSNPDELERALEEIYEKGYYNADASNINFRRLLQFEKEQLSISDRERAFLKLACSDLTYKEIASKMFLSERTIDGYRESLFRKLNVQSRVGMALEAIRREIISLS